MAREELDAALREEAVELLGGFEPKGFERSVLGCHHDQLGCHPAFREVVGSQKD